MRGESSGEREPLIGAFLQCDGGRRVAVTLALVIPSGAFAKYDADDYSGSLNLVIWAFFLVALAWCWARDRLRHWWNPEKAEADDKAAEEQRTAERQAISAAVDAQLAAYEAAQRGEAGSPRPAHLREPFKAVTATPAKPSGGKFLALQQQLQAQRALATRASETTRQPVAPSEPTPEEREELEERQARWRWTEGRNRAFQDLRQQTSANAGDRRKES